MENKIDIIDTSATEIINDTVFRRFLDSKFRHHKNNKTYKNLHVKVPLSIPQTVVGSAVENYLRIQFAIQNNHLLDEILNHISDTIDRYNKYYENCISKTFEIIDRYLILCKPENYDIVIENLTTNKQIEYLKTISYIKTQFRNGKIYDHQEMGCYFLNADKYYGNIIQRLKDFGAYCILVKENKFFDLNDMTALYNLTIFSHTSNNYQWLKVSKNKRNIGVYDTSDLIFMKELLQSLPQFDNIPKNVIYHPKFSSTSETEEFETNLLATGDFIYDDKILEIKSGKSQSLDDFYQVLIYYALTKLTTNEEKYHHINGCAIMYARKGILIHYPFAEILDEESIKIIHKKITQFFIRTGRQGYLYKDHVKQKKK